MIGSSTLPVLGLLGVSILAVGCGGSSTPKQVVTPPTQNVQAIAVDGGPAPGFIYPNGAFTSVTICVPNTTNCQTIGGVLVDTGSYGLRILSSALTLSLPQQNASDGSAVGECTQFIDGSYLWGPVQTADIQLAGEKASSVPVQVAEHGFFTIPNACSSNGSGTEEDDLSSLGANGILGVGFFQSDCGPFCATGSTTPPEPFYYKCATTSGCQPVFETEANQVQNPVPLFATDNNGVIVELPAVSSTTATVSGSLVFGIGTQTNNGLGSANVLTIDPNTLNISTTYGGHTYTNATFLDSGSNGNFFLDSGTTGFPDCSLAIGFYCPSNTQNKSATNVGANGTSTSINFGVANADQLFSTTNNAAFSGLAGPNPGSFDWGLPFFYGRNVFTAIDGKSTPGGTGPYWAY